MRESKYQTDCYNIIHVEKKFDIYFLSWIMLYSVSNRLLQHNSWEKVCMIFTFYNMNYVVESLYQTDCYNIIHERK